MFTVCVKCFAVAMETRYILPMLLARFVMLRRVGSELDVPGANEFFHLHVECVLNMDVWVWVECFSSNFFLFFSPFLLVAARPLFLIAVLPLFSMSPQTSHRVSEQRRPHILHHRRASLQIHGDRLIEDVLSHDDRRTFVVC